MRLYFFFFKNSKLFFINHEWEFCNGRRVYGMCRNGGRMVLFFFVGYYQYFFSLIIYGMCMGCGCVAGDGWMGLWEV